MDFMQEFLQLYLELQIEIGTIQVQNAFLATEP